MSYQSFPPKTREERAASLRAAHAMALKSHENNDGNGPGNWEQRICELEKRINELEA